MSSQGAILARVFTSDAILPIRDVPVTFTQIQPDGSRKLLGIRLTNSSGMTLPLAVDTPDVSSSLTPGSTVKPFALVDIAVAHPGYGSVLAEGVQVFPDVVTVQNLQLTPLPVLPGTSSGNTIINESEQNL